MQVKFWVVYHAVKEKETNCFNTNSRAPTESRELALRTNPGKDFQSKTLAKICKKGNY